MKKLSILLLLTLLFLSNLSAQESSEGIKTWLEEEDGSPSVIGYKLKVTNGTLTDNGDGTVSIPTGGGAGSGDNVTVNSTAIDTTANIKDSTDITWAITDGGAGGPDDIAGTVVQSPKLTTARAINGTDFNGSAAITVPVNNANDTTNATYYPLFTATQGGNYAAKTLSTFTLNPSTGLLTVGGFSGALTGNVTGNVTGSSGSCTGNAGTVTNGAYTTNNLSVFAATTSAQLHDVLSNETGSASGAPLAVFNQAPAIDGNIKNTPHHTIISIVNPNAVVTASTIIPVWTLTDAALTVTKVEVSTSSASYEILADLKWADARIGLGNATLINALDTSSGVLSDSSMTAGAVGSGKFLYISFDSAPNVALTDCVITITWDYD